MGRIRHLGEGLPSILRPDSRVRSLDGLGSLMALPGSPNVSRLFTAKTRVGNGEARSLNYGIDTLNNDALVWVKNRSVAYSHMLYDTLRGPLIGLQTDLTSAPSAVAGTLTSFDLNGFGLGNNSSYVNGNSQNYLDLIFRKGRRFFDIKRFVATASPQNLPHDLGVEPGMIIFRAVGASNWFVWHRSLSNSLTNYLLLTTAAQGTTASWGSGHTAYTFNTGNLASAGTQFIAYIFAHDPADDGIIQCGSYNGSGAAGLAVPLNWMPQFVLIKRINSSSGGSWAMFDAARGMYVGGAEPYFAIESASGETSANVLDISATGFSIMGSSTSGFNASGSPYIYLAIRWP